MDYLDGQWWPLGNGSDPGHEPAVPGLKDRLPSNMSAFFLSLAINGFLGLTFFCSYVFLRRLFPKDESLVNNAQKRVKTLLWEAYTATDQRIMRTLGLDAVLFTHTTRSALWTMIVTAVISIVVLVPVHYYAGGHQLGLSAFSIVNIPRKENDKLWVHVFLCYLLTGAWLVELLQDYGWFVALRQRFLALPIASNVCCMIRDVPRSMRDESNQTLLRYFQEVYGEEKVLDVVFVRDTRNMNEILTELNRLLKQKQDIILESEVLGRRPYTWVWGWEASQAVPLAGCIPWPPCRKADKESVLNLRLQRLDRALREAEEDLDEAVPTNICFVIFADTQVTNVALQSLIMPSPFGLDIERAPEPNDIIWSRLVRGEGPLKRRTRMLVTSFLVILLVLFYTIPVGFISSLTTVTTLEYYMPWLKKILEQYPRIRDIMSGFLPTIGLRLFLALLPAIGEGFAFLRFLVTRTQVEDFTYAMVYIFTIFNVIIVFSFSGAILTELQHIIEKPKHALDILGETLPYQSTFFIMYVLLLAITTIPLRLLQIGHLFMCFWEWFTKKMDCVFNNYSHRRSSIIGEDSEEYVSGHPYAREERQTIDTVCESQIGELFAEHSLVMTICYVYAILSPLLVPFVCIYLAIALHFGKFMSLFQWQAVYITNGNSYPAIFDRRIGGIVLGQMTLAGVLFLKRNAMAALAVLPLIIMTLVFQNRVSGRYRGLANYLALQRNQRRNTLLQLPITSALTEDGVEEESGEQTPLLSGNHMGTNHGTNYRRPTRESGGAPMEQLPPWMRFRRQYREGSRTVGRGSDSYTDEETLQARSTDESAVEGVTEDLESLNLPRNVEINSVSEFWFRYAGGE
eukprot:Clim_evm12s167 gene=Clim_evmTU12s167